MHLLSWKSSKNNIIHHITEKKIVLVSTNSFFKWKKDTQHIVANKHGTDKQKHNKYKINLIKKFIVDIYRVFMI